jgi:hypothetical protein
MPAPVSVCYLIVEKVCRLRVDRPLLNVRRQVEGQLLLWQIKDVRGRCYGSVVVKQLDSIEFYKMNLC